MKISHTSLSYTIESSPSLRIISSSLSVCLSVKYFILFNVSLWKIISQWLFSYKYNLIPLVTVFTQILLPVFADSISSRVGITWLHFTRFLNSLRPRRDRRHFADDIFKCVFLNENEWISLRISLKFVPKVRINNIPSLVQIMAWRRPGDKPLSEPMVV